MSEYSHQVIQKLEQDILGLPDNILLDKYDNFMKLEMKGKNLSLKPYEWKEDKICPSTLFFSFEEWLNQEGWGFPPTKKCDNNVSFLNLFFLFPWNLLNSNI